MADTQEPTAVRVKDLDFYYGGFNGVKALSGVNLTLPRGCRCLLVGDNGAGKTTLLKLLGGRTSALVGDITVLDEPADFSPILNHKRAFLGGNWGQAIIPFAGVTALTADIAVKDMMKKLQAEFPKRREELVQLLQIDENWRMHQVSDGQRRRVQIMLNMLRPVDVLFADEVTTDLDVVTRSDLMAYLRRETEERGLSIVYTTHIFDGLDGWATHIAYLAAGRLVEFGPVTKWPELVVEAGSARYSSLWAKLVLWIRRDRANNLAKLRESEKKSDAIIPDGSGGGYAPGRMANIEAEQRRNKREKEATERAAAAAATTN